MPSVLLFCALLALIASAQNDEVESRPEQSILGIVLPENTQLRKIIQEALITTLSKLPTTDVEFTYNFVTPAVSPSGGADFALCTLTSQGQYNTLLYIPAENTTMQRNYGGAITRLARQGLPTIAWSTDQELSGNLGSEHILQLAPPARFQCEALLDIMLAYKWRQFYVVRTASNGRQFTKACRAVLEDELRFRRMLYMVDEVVLKNPFNLTSTSQQIASRLLSNPVPMIILLLCESNELAEIMRAATSLGMNDDEGDYIWMTSRSAVKSYVTPPAAWAAESRQSRQISSVSKGMIAIDYDTTFTYFKNILPSIIKAWVDSVLELYTSNALPISPKLYCDGDGNDYFWTGGFVLHRKLKSKEFENARTSFMEDGTRNYTRLSIKNLLEDGSWKEVGTWDPQRRLNLPLPITWPGKRKTSPVVPLTHTNRAQSLTSTNLLVITLLLSLLTIR